MSFLLMWGPLLTLALAGFSTLGELKPGQRRGLFPLLLGTPGLGAVLFGVTWGLDQCGLSWRAWVQVGILSGLWLMGLVTGILIIVYARRWLSELGGVMKTVITGLCALSLTSIMLLSGFVILMFAGINSDQVGVYQGRKVVQEKMSWHRCTYYLYEYRGPFIRSRYSIGQSRSPFLEEAVVNEG